MCHRRPKQGQEAIAKVLRNVSLVPLHLVQRQGKKLVHQVVLGKDYFTSQEKDGWENVTGSIYMQNGSGIFRAMAGS
jgi:hypothetical protein